MFIKKEGKKLSKVYIKKEVELKGEICCMADLIPRPVFESPVDGSSGFKGALKLKSFSSSSFLDAKLEATDWEISSDYDFKNIIASSYNDKGNLLTFSIPNIEPNKTYFARARFRFSHHLSGWSRPVRFTTANSFIETPVITCLNNSPNAEFKLSPFRAIGFSDEWDYTEWQITDTLDAFTSSTSTSSGFFYGSGGSPTFISGTVGEGENPQLFKVTDDFVLSPNKTYYVRAKYHGKSGEVSEWSPIYVLKTRLYRLDDNLPNQVTENSILRIKVTREGGSEFCPDYYDLKVEVSQGDVKIHNDMSFTWFIPEGVNKVTISVWVNNKDTGLIMSEKLTKTITVVNLEELKGDTAVSVSNFKDATEYNDGWDLTA